jgi:hypothetical protein
VPFKEYGGSGKAVAQVDRTDQGLKRRSECRRSTCATTRCLALAKQQHLINANAQSNLGECGARDNSGSAFGEVPLLRCRVVGIEPGGNDSAEDGIAKELKALVIGGSPLLVAARRVPRANPVRSSLLRSPTA